MDDDARRTVLDGYDRVADAYARRYGASEVRQRWLDRLLACLPSAGGRVLDLGCGSGVPVARDLASAGHRVVGVDGSSRQIAGARRNVPDAAFLQADMCEVAFAADSFDAVGAFYSITHLPAPRQVQLIGRVARWLRPGGTLVASFGTGVPGAWTGEWLGTPMFFDHPGEGEILRALAEAGLQVRDRRVEQQDNEDASFLWVEAIRGAADPQGSARRPGSEGASQGGVGGSGRRSGSRARSSTRGS